MVVALRATDGLREPDGADGADAVGEVARLVVLRLRAALLGGEQQAVESGGHARLQRGVGQEVAGKLLNGEPVETLVLVERLDDVVAVGEDVARRVGMVADSVRVTHHVQPADGHALAVVRRGEQALDELGVGVWRLVIHERVHLFGLGRQAEQVEVEPARERAAVGLGRGLEAKRLEARLHEMVHGVLAGGDGGLHRRHVSPVRLILSPLSDPALEQILLRTRELLVRVRRRHQVVGVFGEDAFDQLALVGLAGNEGLLRDGVLAHIEAELGLALLLVGAVAEEAVVREDGSDVAVVIHPLRASGGRGESGGREEASGGQSEKQAW